MMKMVIEFDTEKIENDGIYTEEQMFQNIERAIDKFWLTKVDKGIYMDSGESEDLTHFMAIMGWLRQAEWFLKYVTRWDWYIDRRGTVKNVEPENLLRDYGIGDSKERICGTLTSENQPTQDTVDNINWFLEEARKIEEGKSDD